MIIDQNGNGILAHTDQVRLHHDSDEKMYSNPECNEGESITSRQ